MTSTPSSVNAGLSSPIPHFQIGCSERRWRRFFSAYCAARRAFIQDVATAIGGTVAILDTSGEAEIVKQATRH